MKKVVITGGPTNEKIDEVMKITNMSTGSLSTKLGAGLLEAGYKVTLILNNLVHIDSASPLASENENLKIVWVEDTEEMMHALEEESKCGKTDVVVHAAAVGDYKSDYTFLMEDLAKHVFNSIDRIKSEEDALAVMLEREAYQIDNSSKISSYQSNLTVKLGLTPKIIANLRDWYKDSVLIGCKLLENVTKDELYSVATRLCVKNRMDYIMANDLADLRKGDLTRHLVTKEGFTGTRLAGPDGILEFIKQIPDVR